MSWCQAQPAWKNREKPRGALKGRIGETKVSDEFFWNSRGPELPTLCSNIPPSKTNVIIQGFNWRLQEKNRRFLSHLRWRFLPLYDEAQLNTKINIPKSPFPPEITQTLNFESFFNSASIDLCQGRSHFLNLC